MILKIIYNFTLIAEMNIITIAKKLDMSYDFYNKHNMCGVEWILNAMTNKKKKLIYSYNRIWRHPLKRKYRIFWIVNA